MSPNSNNNSANAINNNNNNNNSNNSNANSNSDVNVNLDTIKKSKSGEFNAADLRNSLDRKINGLMYGTKNLSNENLLLETSSTSSISSSSNNNTLTSNSPIGNRPYNSTMVPENHGCLVPPPYRDPPPPRNSPALNDNLNILNNNKKLEKDSINMNLMFNDINEMNFNEMMLHNGQYRDLIQLIKFQRDKITTQQAELTKVSFF